MASHATTRAFILPDILETELQQTIADCAYQFWLARTFDGCSPAADWLDPELALSDLLKAELEIRGMNRGCGCHWSVVRGPSLKAKHKTTAA